jgi:glyoxylase-like metal-dependent hydrolase (beta-lactamase superfamily II)
MPNARVREAVEPAHICGRLPDEIDPDSYSIHAFQITEFVKEGYRIDLGGRILEVVLTPGHTPDSLCLLDRKNGLLFPGDTFYAGPIYLVSPEADFGAYAKSVEKLAKLAATLELLLLAHNEPIADPSNLKKLSVAVRQIQTGGAQPKVNAARREFVFEGFSLVLAAGK